MVQRDSPDTFHSKAQQALLDRSCHKVGFAGAVAKHNVLTEAGRSLLVEQHGLTREHKLYSLRKERVTALRTWQATASAIELGQ